VINNATAVQVSNEILSLIDRNCITNSDVNSTTFLKGAAADDAQQSTFGIIDGTTRVAGINRGIGLQAVPVFKQSARRILITPYAAEDSIGHGRFQIGCQQKGIADYHAPVSGLGRSTVAQCGSWKVTASKQSDHCQVAHRVDSNDDCIVHVSIAHAAAHERARRACDMKVGQCITVRRYHHSAATASAARYKDADRRWYGAGDRFDPTGFDCFQDWIQFNRV